MATRFTTEEALALVVDDELFDAEIGDNDFECESEDEFVAVGDFSDASGSEVLVSDILLSPQSAAMIALVHDTDPANRDSLLNCDDGKCVGMKCISIYMCVTVCFPLLLPIENDHEDDIDLDGMFICMQHVWYACTHKYASISMCMCRAIYSCLYLSYLFMYICIRI